MPLPRGYAPKPLVVDLRGGHGSGKTTAAARVVAGLGGYTSLSPALWATPAGLALVKTENVKGKDDLTYTLELAVTDYRRVLIEGIVSSHTRGRYVELAKSGRVRYKFMFLDTPLEVCVERVRQRRLKGGHRFTGKPFDPSVVIREYRLARGVRQSLLNDKLIVVDVPHEDPLPTILRHLELPHAARENGSPKQV